LNVTFIPRSGLSTASLTILCVFQEPSSSYLHLPATCYTDLCFR